MPKRLGLLLAAVVGGLMLVLGGAGSAAAADAPTVGGTLTDPSGKPVAGATIAVTGPNSFSEQAETDAKGDWSVTLPGSGSYTVTLDTATLPEGLSVSGSNTVTRLVFGGSVQTKVDFTLTTGEGGEGSGTGDTDTESVWSQAVGLAADGLVFGLIIALGAVGLSLIYGTTGLVNFAHGELMTIGALVTYFFNNYMEVPFVGAAILAVIVCAFLGALQDTALWRPLRRRGTGLIAMLVVSIGLGITLRYLFLFLLSGPWEWAFGGGTTQFREFSGQAGLEWGPIAITPKALVGSGVAIVCLLATAWWLLRTRMGKASRAVSDNPSLASASGIDVERVINVVWFLGAGLAALGGILYSLSNGVNWYEGYQLLLLVFVAVTLGGLGTAFGALAGSLVVGVLLQVSTLIIPSELKNVGALAVMILILLVRPQGILGRAERIG